MTTKNIVLVCAVSIVTSVFADVGHGFFDVSRFPPPKGYVRVQTDSPMDKRLTQMMSPDAPKGILAHYVRAYALDEHGQPHSGEDVSHGLITLKTLGVLGGIKFQRDDFVRCSQAIGETVLKRDIGAKFGEFDPALRSPVVLDARQLADGSFSFGILLTDGTATNMRSVVRTSVISWCDGCVFTVVHHVVAKNADNARELQASSEKFIMDWLNTIRLVTTSQSGNVHFKSVAASSTPRRRERSRSGTTAMAMIIATACVWALWIVIRSLVSRRCNPFCDTVDVDQCLIKNAKLSRIITRGMREEWAILIRFFSTGDSPHKLCVPAVLFLWEKLFKPTQSHEEIVSLLKSIRQETGYDKVFSSIKKTGNKAEWMAMQALTEYKFSVTDKIAEGIDVEIPPDFGKCVLELLKTWNGKFEGLIGLMPINWKIFFKNHPELADHELLTRFGATEMTDSSPKENTPNAQDGCLSFLDAGHDGILRGKLWTTQQMVVIDKLSCRLYLPKDWNNTLEIEVISPHDHIARLAGPRPHEWVSVECLHLSPEHVQDDLGDWVNVSRILFGNLNLHPHSNRCSGVVKAKEISFARLNSRDAAYMKYHQADDMAAFVGTIEIESRLHRLFFVIVRRGNESWKFEYVFPANDGVTRESLSFRPEEIVSAARIFVPIETHGRVQCVICGEKMDDPVVGSHENQIEILLKDYFLFDDMRIGKAGLNVPCCASCCEKVRHSGVSREKIELIPDIRCQLTKGASILEIKCGAHTVSLL